MLDEQKQNQFKLMILELVEDFLDRVDIGKMFSESEYLTVKEVAHYLDLSESTVRNLINDGDIPIYRIGDSIRIKKEELEGSLEAFRED